ncbi:alpha/beta fold hydrolase [Nonomuraea soli]|uniref:Pimeloyl-ACP methyl ester carboxylesterase n=1 Tax=Nonomuraea soli TaxID=1032476 RepID=A0A7W0CFN6_9ACTN|nr:alpha/beta hydrolase [Nonomuraea soli]MBA2890268.1 pimeloyl-ACP methyl ester carboxylesterase [Nonomuraea soli]
MDHEVNGRRLYMRSAGAGAPSVVFLAGAGAAGLDYWGLQQRVAELTTAVVYDRSGTGWSDRSAGRLPEAGETVDELRELLRVAGVPGPYVLVGHSLGALFARLYAIRFPGEVAGLVLMDPAHEDYDTSMPQELQDLRASFDPEAMELPDELPAEIIGFYRDLFGRMMAGWPPDVREPLVEAHLGREWLSDGFRAVKAVKGYYDEVGKAGPLPDLPLIVLTATGVDDFKRAVSAGESEALMLAEIDAKRRLYDAFAASVPRGENRPVAGAGHASLPWRGAGDVVRAIRDILTRISGGVG